MTICRMSATILVNKGVSANFPKKLYTFRPMSLEPHLAKKANHTMQIGFYFKQVQEVRDAFVLSTAGKDRELRNIISLSIRRGDNATQKSLTKSKPYQAKNTKSKGLSF